MNKPNNPAFHAPGEPHIHPSPKDNHAHPPKFHTPEHYHIAQPGDRQFEGRTKDCPFCKEDA